MVGRRIWGVAAVTVAILFGDPSLAMAGTSAAPADSTGHDVSYPQCFGAGSTSTTVASLRGQFGVVGVTAGLPWSANPCLAAEYNWASGLAYQPGLYANTANPAPHSSFFWPTSGSRAPALCADSTSTTDPGCAYDYGWHAAANALSTAVASVPGAGALPWWLDVEIANSWNGNGASNAADLQGAVDYLRASGAPAVGIYSSTSAWDTVTGGYTVTTASTYQSAWSSEFTATYPLSGSPTWVAGAGTSASASTTCSAAAFSGTLPQLAQYNDGTGFDADLVCPPPPPQAFTMALSPKSGTVDTGGSTSATVSVTESGPAQTVDLSASGQPSGVTMGFSPARLSGSGSSSMSVTVASAVAPGTYPLNVTGTGSSGTQTTTYILTVAEVPRGVSISISPPTGSVKASGSKQATVTVTEQGAAQGVSLSAVSSSPGPFAKVSPASLQAAGSATLTVSAPRGTPRGMYTITVTATGAAGSRASATYTLTVR
jgi:hypothetical protein